eukprot:scaffold81409_cov52-Phaeocystis_antarctica.AAC.3
MGGLVQKGLLLPTNSLTNLYSSRLRTRWAAWCRRVSSHLLTNYLILTQVADAMGGLVQRGLLLPTNSLSYTRLGCGRDGRPGAEGSPLTY